MRFAWWLNMIHCQLFCPIVIVFCFSHFLSLSVLNVGGLSWSLIALWQLARDRFHIVQENKGHKIICQLQSGTKLHGHFILQVQAFFSSNRGRQSLIVPNESSPNQSGVWLKEAGFLMRALQCSRGVCYNIGSQPKNSRYRSLLLQYGEWLISMASENLHTPSHIPVFIWRSINIIMSQANKAKVL